MDYIEILKTLITAILGGVIATSIKTFLEKKKDLEISLNQITEEKYKSLLVFMACVLDIDKKRYFQLNERVENLTSDDYLNQVKEYYYHSILYSSDNVIIELKKFINTPTKRSYVKVAKAMRNDLWGKKTKLSFDKIKLD